MIIITGAAGFIGSCVAAGLKASGHGPLMLVDDFSRPEKAANYEGRGFAELMERDVFLDWLDQEASGIEAVIHLGARTDTAEKDWAIFQRLNLEYSQRIWQFCSRHEVPLIYASSAATYGDGSQGFEDAHGLVDQLEPLNPYGRSKNEFDHWVLTQQEAPPSWAGLKFFNVYGPNEYHKGRMASVVFHAYHQIRKTGGMRLFRSHNPDFRDGEQLRDFIYVKDIVEVIRFLLTGAAASGIYNLGTGKARTFLDLTHAVFKGMGLEPQISFIDTPNDIRATYQYYTQAEMGKIRATGFKGKFYELEEGVRDYVENYLIPEKYF